MELSYFINLNNSKILLEILFFTSIFYCFSLWLLKDKNKNLILYFYSYCTLILITYFTNLEIINKFLFICSPIATIIFIIVHQQSLQKNFVAFHNPKTNLLNSDDWIETIVKFALTAINKNQTLIFIIERSHCLKDFLSSDFICNSNITHEILSVLTESNSFNPKKMIWINYTGQLVAINACWNQKLENIWENSENKIWEDSIIYSSNMDTIIFKLNPEKRDFDIIAGNKIIKNQSTNVLLRIIKDSKKKLENKNESVSNESNKSKKYNNKQAIG